MEKMSNSKSLLTEIGDNMNTTDIVFGKELLLDKASRLLRESNHCPFDKDIKLSSNCHDCIKIALVGEVLTTVDAKPMCKK